MIYLASEGGAEATSNPLIPDVGEIVITLIGFLILYYIVAKYVVPAFEKIYQDRKEAIEGGLAKAEKAQAEAAAARDEYNQLRLSALAIMRQRLSRQSVRQQQCPSVPRLALLLPPLPARLWAKPSTMMSDRPVW